MSNNKTPFDFKVTLIKKENEYAFEYICPTSTTTSVKHTFSPNELDDDAPAFVENCRKAFEKSIKFDSSNL